MSSSRSFFEELTELVTREQAFTDIRLEQDGPVSVRMPSGWTELEEIFPPTHEDLSSVLQMIDSDWDKHLDLCGDAASGGSQKSAGVGSMNRPLMLEKWRLRINAYLANGGNQLMMSIRRIPNKVPTVAEAGLPAMVRLMVAAPRGLILISGATRSGKSTTAAAMIDAINEARNAHVITIEDPIEYVFERKKSIFSQREVGVDTPSFNQGLEDAMRQCPDVILVGEIRNRETAETAILAGESGHLVIGTVHANTSVGAIQKLLGWFPDNERASKVQSLAGSLVGVVNQMLLPRADGSGYALAAEVLNNYEQAFSAAIGETAKLQSILERPETKGSVLMGDSLLSLVKNKTVNPAEAVRAVVGMPSVQEKLRLALKSQ